MILEIAAAVLSIYLAIGIAMCFRGPLARKPRNEMFTLTMTIALSGKKPPAIKLFAFRALMYLGIVLFWAVFLFDEWRTARSQLRKLI